MPLKMIQLYLTLTALIFLLAVLTLIHLLIKFSFMINASAIFWIIGFATTIAMLLAGISFAYLAATAHKRKQNIRYN
jgi:uncharacterized membrane protein